MSTLDRFIAQVQAAKDKAQSTLASLDGLGATSEAVIDVGHAVGAERYIDGGQHMTDLSESGRAGLHAIIDQSDELLALAESLKTAGPGAAPSTSGGSTDSGTQSSSLQYEVTTGADPKPNPVHATPAHTREPSRKIGDPVKPVELEPPRHVGLSRKRKLGRKSIEGADDVRSMAEEFSEPIGNLDQVGVDPYGPEIRTETVVSQPPAQFQSQQVDPGVTDFVGTAVMMSAAVFEAGGRLWENLKEKRKHD